MEENQEKSKLNITGIRYIVKSIFMIIIQVILLILFSGSIFILSGWIFYILYSITTLGTIAALYIKDIELVNLRGKSQKGTKSWDQKILLIWIIFIFLTPIIAGLDFRFRLTIIVSMDFLLITIGSIIWIIGGVLGAWAMVVNSYFEASARIQRNRSHKVVSIGPYKYIRHPGYLASLMGCIAIPLIFCSLLTIIPSAVIFILFAIRTFLEDKMLIDELDGYGEYTQKVKFRLFPRIW
ncbi:MAG: isoprenylcysteine carboxylmethyltransferase family protein [Candidatus Lokiarchaeota archaeon]|nr:isoprenylcysteine carboxylmethyltransferase family protein [Candidatus Lokiarchaeota archaeon]